jgi:uncharacterized protein (DUF1697 family)
MRYCALFRGINVGKAKRIAMADLRALLERLGYGDVRTLLNSGNAVFSTRATPALRLATRIRTAVGEQLGVDAHVIVKSATDIAAIARDNALVKIATDHSRLLVALTNELRDLAAARPHGRTDFGRERVHIGDHAAFIWCADGILESKASASVLKSLGKDVTTRNWATLLKLEALMAETTAS